MAVNDERELASTGAACILKDDDSKMSLLEMGSSVLLMELPACAYNRLKYADRWIYLANERNANPQEQT